MTETECFECDYSENCDWGLILQNMVPMTPNCKAKAWHDRSIKQFKDMTQVIRERIVGGGEEVKRAEWGNWKSAPPSFTTSPPIGYEEATGRKSLTVGEFYKNCISEKDVM